MKRGRFQVPAVIVGFETNGLGVARALSQNGVPVIAVSTPYRHAATWTRHAAVHRVSEWTEEALVSLLLRVGEQLGERAPILITKDECVHWIAAHQEELRRHFRVVLPDRADVDLLMNKQEFQDLAEKEGWPVPRTWAVNSEVELETVLASAPLPAILKPRVKNSTFRAKSPSKAYVCRTAEDLRSSYRLVAQWESEVVVQEFIQGGDDRIAFCLGYWGDRHEPEILFSGRKLRQWPILSGNTAFCEPAPSAWAAQIEPLTKEIFRRTRLRGLGSVEYKMRSGSDEAVIMEPTVGRTNFQNEVAVVNGYNVPLVAYCHALGYEIPKPSPTPQPIQLIDELTERRAAEGYQSLKLMTSAECLAQVKGRPRRMLFHGSDPVPFLVWRSRELWSGVRRRIGSIGRSR